MNLITIKYIIAGSIVGLVGLYAYQAIKNRSFSPRSKKFWGRTPEQKAEKARKEAEKARAKANQAQAQANKAADKQTAGAQTAGASA